MKMGIYTFYEETGSHKYAIRALARKVLVVASITKKVNEWKAYIDAVEGLSHENEWRKVVRSGTKIDHRIAKILFPDLDKKYVWVD